MTSCFALEGEGERGDGGLLFSSPELKAYKMSLYYRLGLSFFIHHCTSSVHTFKLECLLNQLANLKFDL